MNSVVEAEHGSAAKLWFARLQLGFEADCSNGRTILQHRKHEGPVRVQKMI